MVVIKNPKYKKLQETPILVDIQPGNTSRPGLDPPGHACAAQERTVLNVQPPKREKTRIHTWNTLSRSNSTLETGTKSLLSHQCLILMVLHTHTNNLLLLTFKRGFFQLHFPVLKKDFHPLAQSGSRFGMLQSPGFTALFNPTG